MCHPSPGACVRQLWMQNRGAWDRGQQDVLLLCALRPQERRNGRRGSRMRGREGSPTLRVACLAGLWLLAGCNANGPEESPLFNAGERGPAVLASYGVTSAVEVASSA